MDSLQHYIGLESERITACDAVEAGAVRRFAHAVMDTDPAYHTADSHGAAIAPALFPAFMFWRPSGAPDPLDAAFTDSHFDGAGATSFGLPAIPELQDFALLNGGSEVELFQFARHGDRVSMQSRYLDIRRTQSKGATLVFVVIESTYRNQADEVLLTVRRTHIRRKTA